MNIISYSKYFLLLISILFIVLQSYSQTGTLKGTISDNESNELIPYVTVILKNSENKFLTGTTTNENGFYQLEYNEGNYNLELSFMGYKTQSLAIDLKKM